MRGKRGEGYVHFAVLVFILVVLEVGAGGWKCHSLHTHSQIKKYVLHEVGHMKCMLMLCMHVVANLNDVSERTQRKSNAADSIAES